MDSDRAEISMPKNKLTSSLQRGFAFIKTSPQMLVSMVLDHRFKHKYFSTEEINRCETMLTE